MSGLFGLGRKNKTENEVDSTSGTGTQTGVGSGTNTGYGSTSQRGTGVGSEEAKNLHYEGTTASGARSGRTGATSQLDSGVGSGTGTGTGAGTGLRSGTGTGTGTGTTGTSGISEGFRGMNLTHQSGYEANHPVVGDSTIVCDTKYYTAIEDRPIIKEIKTYIREHHPIEKEFVVETRPTGQEREQVQNRTSEVVNTRESIIETTPADPCGGVPTSQYNAGTTGTGTGMTGSRGATTGAGYGTGSGTGAGTGSGIGSGASGQGTGAGGRTIT